MPPDLSHIRRPLVYGGSFDPPQVAHVQLPRLAREAVGADAVLYIPAYRSPFKADREPGAGADHRLAMLQLAVADDPASVVLDDELVRGESDGGVSYTVDTLELLRQRLHPKAAMRLLIGTDQLVALPRWHRGPRVVELASPVVMIRPPYTLASARAWVREEAPPWLSDTPLLLDLPPMGVSATAVRAAIREGRPIRSMVPEAVEAYIRERGLYG